MLHFTGITKEIVRLKGALGGSINIQKNTGSFWNGKLAPNSNSTILVFGISSVWSIKHSGINFNIRVPIFLKGGFNEDIENIDQEIKGLQISIGYRKIFNWTIPWIDPLKGL